MEAVDDWKAVADAVARVAEVCSWKVTADGGVRERVAAENRS